MTAPRPTPEQLAEYEAKFAATGEPVFLQGVSVVGDFMGSLLGEFSDSDAEHILHTLGRLCFGRDPWVAFDKMWVRVQSDLEHKRRCQTYADNPVKQTIPRATELLTEYLAQVKSFCGDQGILPQPLLWEDADAKLTMMSIDADGGVCFNQAKEVLEGGLCQELVFGMDRSAVPGQGLEFNDFVTVVWYVGGEFYTAVIDYVPAEDEADQIMRAPNWNNNWWNNHLKDDMLPQLRAALEAATSGSQAAG